MYSGFPQRIHNEPHLVWSEDFRLRCQSRAQERVVQLPVAVNPLLHQPARRPHRHRRVVKHRQFPLPIAPINECLHTPFPLSVIEYKDSDF